MATTKVDIVVGVQGAEAGIEKLEKFGDTAQTSVEKVAKGVPEASGALKVLEETTHLVTGKMHELAGEAGPLGEVLTKFGPAGLAAAAAFGVLTGIMIEGVHAAEAAERSQLRIQASLNATGYAAGLSSEEIRQNAEALSQATLATKQEVEDASLKLLAFRSITGDTFKETLRLAQDMASAGFGSLSENVDKLGRSLNDPIRGLQAMQRVFGDFSPVVAATVKELEGVGNTVEAQRVFLDEIRRLVGGTGEAEANSLSGAWHRWTEELDNWYERVGKATGAGEALAAVLDKLTQAQKYSTWLKTPEGELARLEQEAEEDVVPTWALGTGLGRKMQKAIDTSDRKAERDARIAQLKAEIAATEALAQQEKDLTEQRGKQAQDELAQEKAWERRQQLLDKAMEAGEREAEQQEQEAKRRADIVDKARVEADAKARIYNATLLGTAALTEANKQIAIEAAVRSLGAEATAEQVRQVTAYTAAAFDAAEATKVYNKEQEEAERAAEKAARAVEKAGDEAKRAAERQAREIERFALDAGTNVVDAFWDAAKGAEKSFDGLLSYAEQTFKKIVAAALLNPIIIPAVTQFIGSVGAGAGAGGGVAGVVGSAGDIYGLGANAGLFPSAGASFANTLNTFGVEHLGMNGLIGPHGEFVGFEGSGSLSGALGAAGLGYVGGGLLAKLTGGNKTGGSIGGGLGAGTAMLMTGNPFIAAGVAVITSLLGGLFGGKPSDKTEASRINLTNNTSEAIFDPDKRDSENRTQADTLTTAFLQFKQTLAAAGLNSSASYAAIEVGNRGSPYRAQFGSGDAELKSFDNAKDAFTYLAQQLVGSLENVPAKLQDEIDNIDWNNLDAFTEKLQQIAGFNAAMTQIRDRIKQLEDPEQYEIDQLDKQYEPIRQAARDLGEDLTDIEKAYGLERAQIAKKYAQDSTQTTSNWLRVVSDLYDKQIATTSTQIDAAETLKQSWEDVVESLGATMDSLRTDASLSPLSLEARKNEALRQFNTVYDKAMIDKDPGAFAQLDNLARAFLEADMAFNQGNSAYGADFDDIMSKLEQARQFAGQQVTIEQLQLDALQAILAAIQDRRDSALGTNTPAGYTAADLAALQSQAGAAFNRSGMSLQEWVNSDDAKNVWIPARDALTAGITDPVLLNELLRGARSQKATPGLEAFGTSYEDSVIAQMNKLGIQVPSYDVGGMIPRTELAMVHAGERMLTVAQNRAFEETIGNLGRQVDVLIRVVAASGNVQAAHLQSIATNTAATANAPFDAAALQAAGNRSLAL